MNNRKSIEAIDRTIRTINEMEKRLSSVKEELLEAEKAKEVKYEPEDIWGLDRYLSSIILPPLKLFKESKRPIPGGIPKETWEDILDKMILAHQIIAGEIPEGINEDNWREKAKEGLELFAKYYRCLNY